MQAETAETESTFLKRQAYGHRPGFRLDLYEGRREAAKLGFRALASRILGRVSEEAEKLCAPAGSLGF